MIKISSSSSGRLRTFIRHSGRWSLPDWVFLPMAVVVAGGLIVLALGIRPGVVLPTMNDEEFILAGDALGQLIPSPGTQLQLVTAANGDTLARLSATATFESVYLTSPGIGVALPPEWEAQVIGRMVRVEALMQPAIGSGVTQVRLAYFTTGFGDSERVIVDLNRTWSWVGMCFQVPDYAEVNNTETMSIWPGDRGDGDAVMLRDFRVTIEQEGVTHSQCLSRIGVREAAL